MTSCWKGIEAQKLKWAKHYNLSLIWTGSTLFSALKLRSTDTSVKTSRHGKLCIRFEGSIVDVISCVRKWGAESSLVRVRSGKTARSERKTPFCIGSAHLWSRRWVRRVLVWEVTGQVQAWSDVQERKKGKGNQRLSFLGMDRNGNSRSPLFSICFVYHQLSFQAGTYIYLLEHTLEVPI